MSKLYPRFLFITRDLGTNKKSLKDVDSTGMLSLNEIAIKHLDEKPLMDSQAMKLDAIASSSTIHRKLDELHEAGLIDLTFEGKNRRKVPNTVQGSSFVF